MVRFENNELEVAIVTYNRQPFIEEWIKRCYEDFTARNIKISIYDSSSDGETERYITSIKDKFSINYIKVPSDVEIGYKPMLPILQSNADYVWVTGDSMSFEISELDEKVFPYIKESMDFVLICTVSNYENDGKVYVDKDDFVRDCLISMTCIGLSIYKRSVFDVLKDNQQLMKKCDELYRHNYGFGWMGYFLWAWSKGDYKAKFAVVDIFAINPNQKTRQWAKRFYGCWVEDLIDLCDSLPDVYSVKSALPKETWIKMNLDSHYYCHMARINGGLTTEDYEKYLSNGMLQRVSDKLDLIEFYSCAPDWKIEMVYGYAML